MLGEGDGSTGGGDQNGDGRRRSRKEYWSIAFRIALTVLLVLCIVAIPTLSIGLKLGAEPHKIDSTEKYSLSDNRIISYKGDFCEKLKASSKSRAMNQQSMGHLYFLRSHPPLTKREIINASVTANLASNFHFQYWNFYLNTGSEAHFRMCYQPQNSSRNMIFYIIRGLNKQIKEPSSREAVETYHLTLNCDNIVYEVLQDSMYYFIVSLYDGNSGTVNVNFIIDRLLYDVQPNNIVHECSFALDGRSSCSLSEKMDTTYTAVLSLNTSRSIDYTGDGVKIHISCEIRGGLYAVIVLLVVFVIFWCAGGAGIILSALLHCYDINRSHASSDINRSHGINAVVPGPTRNNPDSSANPVHDVAAEPEAEPEAEPSIAESGFNDMEEQLLLPAHDRPAQDAPPQYEDPSDSPSPSELN